ncbi:prostatic acid phosphatase-like [Phoenicopterus ruber ruber]
MAASALHPSLFKETAGDPEQVFRHGDHTPQEFFPTYKHKEVSRQQGYGQLTKLGIQQQYELGQYMRRRYSYFLSVVYKQREIYVQSTDCDHTLMSAQASLAGLYPPTQGQIWNPKILWQPIPVHTVPLSHDNHAATIVALQMALNVFNGKLPPYSACHFFELYQEKNGQYTIEMYYRNNSLRDPHPLTLPGCKFRCPLERFTQLVSPVLVHYWTRECRT